MPSKLLQPILILCLITIALLLSCHQELQPIKNPKTENITVASGFIVEHLFSPSDNEYGSWVSMTFDDRGRMIASDQFGSLYRLFLPQVGEDSSKLVIERITLDSIADTTNKVDFGYAQGLLWAFDGLYVMVNHHGDENFEKSSGLYRLEDTNGDDKFDKITKLIELEGDGEHGPHSVVLGPDGQSLYIVAGNHTLLPEMDSYKLPKRWDEDNIFPLILDPQGHATDVKAPGGWIAKTDPYGNSWELVAAGLRNTFDIAFNKEGDLFAYDSDMEWDFGMPWYRPARILHVTSGADFGWRTGNSKWSPDYIDNLPSMLNIGQGSPTNLMDNYSARFPEAYRNGLFAFDWSFGIIYNVTMEQEGATYKAQAEEFLSGSPLALTDGEIGPDGALYFMTGGRRLESDLYRVYHKKHNRIKTRSLKSRKAKISKNHQLRKKLEEYHTKVEGGAVEKIWPYLEHEDRHIRYAARVALEHQPVSQWKDKLLREKSVDIKIQATLAVARIDDEEWTVNELINILISGVDVSSLNNIQKSEFLRTLEVIMYRKGVPEGDLKDIIVEKIAPLYPATSNGLNQQLSKVLIRLDDTEAIYKTVKLLITAEDEPDFQEAVTNSSDLILRNPQYGLDIAGMLEKTPPAQQIYYATILSAAKYGWTEKLYDEYFRWFNDAFGYKGGHSYIGFVNEARKMALSHVKKEDFDYYNEISGDSLLSSRGTSIELVEGLPKGPGKGWKVDEALKIIEEGKNNRNFIQGALLFKAVRCSACHSMRGEGGSYGPDLTQLGNRYSAKDILEKLVDPSKNISDQYASQVFHMKDGSTVLGKRMKEDLGYYYISQNPYDPQNHRKLAKRDVADIKTSKVSIMPPGTINVLNEEELKDLMAYLTSSGDSTHSIYSNQK